MSHRASFNAPVLRRATSVVALALGSLVVSCSDPGAPSAPIPDNSWRFTADFEGATALRDLFSADTSGWTNVQCVQPDGTPSNSPVGLSVVSGANRISLDTSRARATSNALRFEAPPSGANVSKASLVKQGLEIRPGNRIEVEFQLYLDSSASARDVFLFALESTEMDGFAGRRLAISGTRDLLLESKNAGKPYGAGPDFQQAAGSRTPLPTGRWVSIRIEVDVSRDSTGGAKIWQDGVLVLDRRGRTFPQEAEFTRYDWLEFGLTANASPYPQSLWMDEITIGIE